MRSRIVATCIVLGLLGAACSNATSDKPTSTATTIKGAPPITEVSAADLHKKVAISGVQGVTDDSINVADRLFDRQQRCWQRKTVGDDVRIAQANVVAAFDGKLGNANRGALADVVDVGLVRNAQKRD